MRRATVVLFVVFVCTSGLLGGNEEAQDSELMWRWEELPLPPSKHRGISQIGIEPGGVLWVMANNLVYYWDGGKFRQPLDVKLTSGYYSARLWGGGDRKLYATQGSEKEHQGKLYELVDGQALYVTDFYYEVGHEYPGLYVSKSGKLFNWGRRFLAVYVSGEWHRIETPLRKLLIFDTGEKVYLYSNQNLYSVDKDGNFEKREIVAPTEIVCGALWGRDKMFTLKYEYKGVYVYYLESGKRADKEQLKIHSYLDVRNVYDVFRAGDGSVWLLTSDRELQSYVFLRITPKGKITRVKETSRFGWENSRCRQFPHSVLNASDGSIWFGTPREGIARYKDGKMDMFGWQQGVSFGGCHYLLEGQEGEIYAASYKGVYVFHRGQEGQLPEWVKQWEEYRLACLNPIRDHEGNIWMCLEDHPGKISRWDGQRWEHIRVPFNTSQVSCAMADDQGHILMGSRNYSEACYDISISGVKRYENWKSVLVAAVSRGARRFSPDSSFQGCVSLESGKIWFGSRRRNRVYYFDGKSWGELDFLNGIDYLYESAKYGMLLRTTGDRHYRYDRGQFVEVVVPRDRPSRWLLGAQFLRPFEEELLKAHPGEYIPVERAEDGKLYLLVPVEKSDVANLSGKNYVRGNAIHRSVKTVTPGLWGGHWSDYDSAWILRFFGDKILQCDLRDTPLFGKDSDIRQVLEDRAHNLWIDAGLYSGAKHVFMKRLDDFELKSKEVPAEAKRSVKIMAEAFLGGLKQAGTRLFWRFEGGRWRGGDMDNSATIYFPSEGHYKIEIVGMEPQGGVTPEPLNFTIYAKVPLPETVLTEKGGPYVCKDVTWEVPAKAIPSEPGEVPHLTYRVNDGEWQVAYKGHMIAFGGLQAGEYRVEVAAREGEVYYDRTPLVFDVKYAPDYDWIVESRLDIITGEDTEQAKDALFEIKMAGSDIVLILEEKLAEARRKARLIGVLERILQELSREQYRSRYGNPYVN